MGVVFCVCFVFLLRNERKETLWCPLGLLAGWQSSASPKLAGGNPGATDSGDSSGDFFSVFGGVPFEVKYTRAHWQFG